MIKERMNSVDCEIKSWIGGPICDFVGKMFSDLHQQREWV
jgi:hypothetical protein